MKIISKKIIESIQRSTFFSNPKDKIIAISKIISIEFIKQDF